MLKTQLRKMSTIKSYPQEFVNFLNNSPTPYHAVANIKEHLLNNKFKELKETDTWTGAIAPLGRYFVTRNNSSIISFCVGNKWQPGNPMAITGAHTDSPVLRIKPVSKKSSEKYQQIGVEIYGGGIWHSWFDSDLSIAGRVMVNDKKTGNVIARLVDLKKPLLKIPTLAIHLDREVNQKFEFNKESELLPIAGLNIKDSKDCCGKNKNIEDTEFSSIKSIIERHHIELLDLIVKELSLESVSDIEDFELILYDHKPSCLGGINEEFVFSGRLDNLTSCFTSMHAITAAAENGLEQETGLRMMACFDHEEIGSSTAQGADSNFLPNILERLNQASTYSSGSIQTSYLLESSAKSFFLSSDVAHGIHPNYANKYESDHKPQLGAGPAIKINANQRYMTNSPGLVLIKKVADEAKVPLQLFVVKNDSPCGSTIGPILASKTGIRTLDLGNPILSMHSIRETGGSGDIELQIKLFEQFFVDYSKIYESIVV
ncbi:hypothetical protein Kpol_1016p10 [Vanderwaltozyma polyspora DSM 70294]|uniref:aspartyl aminopeptidase n=1 Tax=Vanderwaltozyma polyspora (strain ATCC 22028 / DSM 70294 / BCRC 21397 / CBS 2163 / NBRC 10782 / NRRL Y-8283 / UCD 57-17) TaxID=436907 RepID=A7TNS7_VANPO|nr:uncharacterized protein Kpol_1016p10 [Vanderwaltozyma polyspora DSM 70294]EDO16070.1 hypothetical protein Kpol_1016p10 [Vanderwaltozyma polyspora DSM 70294]